jgi:hypothetical protein
MPGAGTVLAPGAAVLVAPDEPATVLVAPDEPATVLVAPDEPATVLVGLPVGGLATAGVAGAGAPLGAPPEASWPFLTTVITA